MSMTKKDYELIAKGIRAAALGPAATTRLVDTLVPLLCADNPKFQPDTFRFACRNETPAERRKAAAGRDALTPASRTRRPA